MSHDGLEALLVVQGHDTRLDQLRHRLATLAERAARDEARSVIAGLETEAARLGERRAELLRDQKRLEDEIASIDAKRQAHDARLYGGTVTNARELQDLQEEIESLGRRINQLEDQQLEFMEQIEPLDADLSALAADQATQNAQLEAAETALIAAEAELAVDVDAETSERATAVVGIDEALLAEYERLRAGLGGIAIARLEGNQCGGCHLSLAAVEVAALRKNPDEVAHCEECGRILVP